MNKLSLLSASTLTVILALACGQTTKSASSTGAIASSTTNFGALTANISLPDGPRNGANTISVSNAAGEVIDSMSCGAGLGSEAGPVSVECSGHTFYVLGTLALARPGQAWTGELAIYKAPSGTSLELQASLTCIGNVRGSGSAIKVVCAPAGRDVSADKSSGIGGSIHAEFTEGSTLTVNYFDTGTYFGDRDVQAYVEIHKVVSTVGDRAVEVKRLPLSHLSPEDRRYYGASLSVTLSEGEVIEFLKVAFSDKEGKKWDSNFGQNYRLDLH